MKYKLQLIKEKKNAITSRDSNPGSSKQPQSLYPLDHGDNDTKLAILRIVNGTT